MVSYVLFSLLFVLLLTGCLIFVSIFVGNGKLVNFYPYGISTEEDCEERQDAIGNLGGWIEELDGDFHVTRVFGEKKIPGDTYSRQQLARLTSVDVESEETYIGFLNEKKDGEGYYLVFYKRSDMTISMTWLYSNQNANPRWYYIWLVMVFVCFVGLCIGMGAYLVRRIKRPLKNLTDGMNQVCAGKEMVRLDFKAEAEFADIRDDFNQMIESLENAQKEKQEAEEKKNKMLLDLSHDIRTPLATINSSIVALEQGMVPEEEVGTYYEIIRMKTERVTGLSDNLFTLLKMKSSNYKLQKTKEDLCEFLRRQCGEYYLDALEKGLEMEIAIPEEPVMYEADYTLLARVMGNLLSNALKYNQTGKLIGVSLIPGSDSLCIQVWDDGEAVPQELQDRIFYDFERGDKARQSTGGTGLGLSIAKAIIEKHGGTLCYSYEDHKNHFFVTVQP